MDEMTAFERRVAAFRRQGVEPEITKIDVGIEGEVRQRLREVEHDRGWVVVAEDEDEEYEDDFREKMVGCGVPVDKPLEKE